MPGIYGYIKQNKDEISQLDAMSSEMRLYSRFIQDRHYEDENVAISRVHLGNIGMKDTPYQKDNLYIWVEGETYNNAEISKKMELSSKSFAHTLADAYKKGKLDAFLNKIDGYFCAIIYDSLNKKLLIVSDRYGMRMLYWYHKGGLFTWASEVKGILALKGVDKTIDPMSPNCFMDLGYLMGEHTWFKHIKPIKPATVIEFDIDKNKCSERHYWKWSEIKPSNISFKEAVNRLGELFIRSVEKRFNPNEKIGISLSGGLDSRAIFAAVNYLYPDYTGCAYTFGKPNCDDIKIAEQVVKLSNWNHRIFHFNENNWFDSRIEKIWNTDGMMNMLHMHGSEFLDEISESMDINLNGYAGDVVMGGGFLNKTSLNVRISKGNSIGFYKQYYDLSEGENEFYDIRHVEPHLYMNRVRRFTNMGTVNNLVKIDQRKPFFDNDIVELVFSLPDEYRLNNKLYSTMLLKFFPKFYQDIPWQKTGKTVHFLPKESLPKKLIRKGKSIIKEYLLIKDNKNYVDYPRWIREKSVFEKIVNILGDEPSIVDNYLKENIQEKYLIPHLRHKKDFSEKILRAVTMEVYLKKVLNNEE